MCTHISLDTSKMNIFYIEVMNALNAGEMNVLDTWRMNIVSLI